MAGKWSFPKLDDMTVKQIGSTLLIDVRQPPKFSRQPPVFNEDDIRRSGLPKDVFGILHDLAYHHQGRDVWDYVRRAQAALRSDK